MAPCTDGTGVRNSGRRHGLQARHRQLLWSGQTAV